MVIPLVLLIAAGATLAPPVPRLRGASARETAIIADLLARSPTARTLATGLEAPSARFVRVTLAPSGHPDDLAALLAHELQHVLEIARSPDVIDSRGVRRLYSRIGNDRSATAAFETAAAQEVALQVRRELSRGSGRAADRPVGHP